MALSEEQRKKMAANLAKAREVAAANREAAKAKAAAAATEDPEPLEVPAPIAEPTISVTEYRDLLAQIEELKRVASSQYSPTPQQTPQVEPRGRLVGTFEKYVVDPKHYPDPTAQLAKEPRLARFAFDVNYELGWTVTTTSYETRDGINTVEPRFTIELIKVILDEETGEPTTGRYVLRSLVLHEDPQAALSMARANGLDPETYGGEWKFLDAMRYLRIRDWLLDAFYPPKNTGKKGRKEAVIGNRVVQLYEVSSVDPAAIDFGAKKVNFGD